MHMDEMKGRQGRDSLVGSIVKVINILGYEKKVAAPLACQVSQGDVRGVWTDVRQLATPFIVEGLNKARIVIKCLRCRNGLDAMTAP